MSDLNLIPDSCIVAVQAGIFVANAFVVKKFFLEPFLEVKSKRDALTIAAKSSADSSQEESKRKELEIEESLSYAHTHAQERYQKAKAEAAHAHQTVVDEAAKKSAEQMKDLQSSIRKSYEEEQKKVEPTVSQLVEDLYPALIG